MATKRMPCYVTLSLIFLFSSLAESSFANPSDGGTIGGGGGPLIMWKSLNSSGLDDLARDFGVPGLGGFAMGVGGGGYAIFSNARIGGLGAGASVSSTEIVGGIEHKLTVEFGYGGFLAEYVKHHERFNFSVGCLLGGGGYTVKLAEGEDERKEEKGFFCLEPCIGAGIRLVHFAWLQGWVGYLFAPGEEMAINFNDTIYRFTPGEMGGFNFRLMLVFGAQM